MASRTMIGNSELLGQEKAKRLLGKALQAGRLPHALLFRGPDGVGKKLFARDVAAAVNCRQRIGPVACGKCSSCEKYQTNSHPDFVVVSPVKGIIRIEQIRELSRELSYPPYESTMRIMVIEDIHTMRREAANCLLKTLEEPPAGNLLILTAEESQEILPTISSRCQVVPFTRLSVEDTTSILLRRGIEKERVAKLAKLSDGRPGFALALKNNDILSLWRELVETLCNPAIMNDRDIDVILRLAEKMTLLKDELPILLHLLKVWLRDLLLDLTQDISAENTHYPRKSWSSSELFARLQAISKAEEQLARNCGRTLVCEVLLFALQ